LRPWRFNVFLFHSLSLQPSPKRRLSLTIAPVQAAPRLAFRSRLTHGDRPGAYPEERRLSLYAQVRTGLYCPSRPG
jgi:hypothetical protein